MARPICCVMRLFPVARFSLHGRPAVAWPIQVVRSGEMQRLRSMSERGRGFETLRDGRGGTSLRAVSRVGWMDAFMQTRCRA